MSTETVVSKKYRVLVDASAKVWNRISFWTRSRDVYNNNDQNLQTTCGSITGISDSLTSTSSNVAASAASVKALNDKITELSSNLKSNKEGTFTGTASGTTNTINVGFSPSDVFLIVTNSYGTNVIIKTKGDNNTYGTCSDYFLNMTQLFVGQSTNDSRCSITITDSGFTFTQNLTSTFNGEDIRYFALR